MSSHRVASSLGREFEIVLSDDGRIVDVAGEWPKTGQEFELHDPPAHSPARDVPAEIASSSRGGGRDVCFYDPDGCRTCFCDEDGRLLRCVGMC